MKDVARALSPLGLMILALLGEGDMHPYEMIRLMRQRRDERLVTITNGTVYHTVGRLERAGLLAEVGIDREGNRPERTTYTQTADGRAAVVDWVRRELARIDRPAEFRVALAEAHNLERHEVVALLRGRAEALAERRSDLAAALHSAHSRGVPAQYLIEAERELALLGSDLEWLDSLHVRLAQDDFPWGAPDVPSARYLEDRKAARR
ncbi:PadR family transcriptional regulator [Microbacterium sp. SS28]|uniref:PadR family transcriptional regulator n=1 Tax=Microbacterium sp. SS28 TaxID=2919948 RepID=UPI001FAB2BC8|nr:PadR family transcriptional regulator [Microbacterium sp. SS28]